MNSQDANQLPPSINVFEPGISPTMHSVLRSVLVMLNVILLGLTIAKINPPHSMIMLLLSLGLTGSYFYLMYQLAEDVKKEL